MQLISQNNANFSLQSSLRAMIRSHFKGIFKFQCRLFMFVISVSEPIWAMDLAGREFPETQNVGSQNLTLNGWGLRTAERFGLTFKVYVGALYTVNRITDEKTILESQSPMVLRMAYLRRVDKVDVVEALERGHGQNCDLGEKRCAESKKVLKQLTALVPDLLDKSSFEWTLLPDRVIYHIKGRSEIKGELMGEDISRNIKLIYFGQRPASVELKAGLLGAIKKE